MRVHMPLRLDPRCEVQSSCCHYSLYQLVSLFKASRGVEVGPLLTRMLRGDAVAQWHPQQSWLDRVEQRGSQR